VQLAIVSYLK